MPSTTRASKGGAVRLLDLFSGAGGLSRGFLETSRRFVAVGAVESDICAAATYAANHPRTKMFAGGIETWLKGGEQPTVDVVVGGPPCQGFSSLGSRSAQDTRNQLWLYYAETIRRAQPKFFVLENVPTFLDSIQLQRFRRQTQPSGKLGDYTFQARILNAADYGAAQVRRRAVLIGHHRDVPFPGFPPATHMPDDWLGLKDVLVGLPERVSHVELPSRTTDFAGKTLPGPFSTQELHLTRYYEPRSLKRFEHIGPGGNRFDLPDHLLSPCWRSHASGSADVMGRLAWDRPSVTIRTEFFKPEKGRYLHPTEDRALTHHEAARIQGFPDDYAWIGSKTAIARQIGNAVPIPLARAIARQLL